MRTSEHRRPEIARARELWTRLLAIASSTQKASLPLGHRPITDVHRVSFFLRGGGMLKR